MAVLLPVEKLFDIIFEDEDLLVINKPTGLVCHPTKNGEIFLLDGAVFENFPQLASYFGVFGDDDDAAGFAVEPVDQMRLNIL